MSPKHLSEPWFSLVATGKKVYEGRLGNSAMASEPVGATIEFYNDDLRRGSRASGSANRGRRVAKVTVTGIERFGSFRAMLEHRGPRGDDPLAKTLPTVRSVDDGVAVYRAFYSAADERKHGVVRIGMRLLVDDRPSKTKPIMK